MNISKISFVVALLAIAVAPFAATHAQALRSTQQLRVSVKVILHNNGAIPPPSDSGQPTLSRADLRQRIVSQVDRANQLFRLANSSLRLDLVEVVEVPGFEWLNGADPNFSAGFLGCNDARVFFNQLAPSDPRLAFRTDAANIYIVRCSGGNNGVSGLPGNGTTTVIRPDGLVIPYNALFAHELGHHFGLKHTHSGGSVGARGDCATLTGPPTPGDDGLPDTLPDSPCFSQDDLARNSFGASYAQISAVCPNCRELVDDTFDNLMSYHPTQQVLTATQLQRIVYVALTSRAGEYRPTVTFDQQVPPGLSSGQRDARESALAGWFVGDWLAVSNGGFLPQLRLRRGVGNSLTATNVMGLSGNFASVRFDPSVYSDALYGVGHNYSGGQPTGWRTTFTLKRRIDNQLEARILLWGGPYLPLLEQTVVLRRL